ncbi:MAG: TIR domain-containing protein [Caulobacteraceae bacterium]|nr:TIR domain-containing protein [Caulobacteraceae bacterium]
MSDVFISYARSTAKEARGVADGLRAEGYSVWWDDDLPAHRAYSEVIEEQLATAKAVLVIWSAEAVKSEWVRSEANRAREERKLVQLNADGARLPMPFDQIQCADLAGWSGDRAASGWVKVVASVAELAGAGTVGAPSSAPGAAAQSPSKPSIAVMPFVNLSNDPEQEYFSDGMTEEIVAALSRFRSIFVIASSSTMTFKGRAVAPQELRRTLGVRFVLEGSIRRSAERVRIAARLLGAADGIQVWGDRFDERLDDIFALQDRVAESVAGVIVPVVREAEIRRVSAVTADDLNAYDLYLRALPHYRSLGARGTRQALQLLTRAAELDPGNGDVLSLAASCHSRLSGLGWSDEPASHRRQAVDLARRALHAAGDDPEVLVRVASVLAHETTDDVSRIFDRAIALNPTSAMAHTIIGNYRLAEGDLAPAQEHLEAALRLDPLSPARTIPLALLGATLFAQRRYAEALAPLTEAIQISDESMSIGYAVLGACHAYMGQAGPAAAALERARSMTSLPLAELVANLVREERTRAHLVEGLRLAEASPTAGP